MIVVDTSALMSILNAEPSSGECLAALKREAEIIMSAGTYTEAKIVAARRGLAEDMGAVLLSSISEIVSLTSDRAHLAADAYARWGKGFHPAGLNFGDCFAYALARERDCPLLYVGKDFSLTDIRSAIPRP
ncbi:MAG: type II toxin-antitoxin system VapC family toxin [Allorhizobium sp.]